MTSREVLAAMTETGFDIDDCVSLWVISGYHEAARARLHAQRTAEGWRFTLCHAGAISTPRPATLHDLVADLTRRLGTPAGGPAGRRA